MSILKSDSDSATRKTSEIEKLTRPNTFLAKSYQLTRNGAANQRFWGRNGKNDNLNFFYF